MKKSTRLLIFMAVLLGCSEDFEHAVPGELGLDYFPLTTGYFRTYAVDQIEYEISGFDTTNFFMRETVVDSFGNGSSVTYLIRRETADNDSFDWKSVATISWRRENNQLIATEGNLPLVRLVFPPKVGTSWDGNAFNSSGFDEFDYLEAAPQELATADTIWSDIELIKVVQEDLPANIVNQNQQWEVYGKGVGLIEKKSLILNFCTVDCDSAGQILSGRFMSQQLMDYGQL